METAETEKPEMFNKTKLILPGAIILAALIISGTIFYSNGLIGGLIGGSNDDDPFLGPEKAKVTIIEFSDYQCSFCRSFWRDALNRIKSEYINSGKVKFVYRDFPLSFHPLAQKYAEGAECAGDQNKYWEMHDKIFEEQDKLGQGTVRAYGINDIKRWAGELG